MKTNPHEPRGLREKGRARLGLLSVAAFSCLMAMGGCTSFRDAMSPYETSQCRCITDIRARMKARQIWRKQYAHCYGNMANARDIKQGFIDGFAESCLGGDGCPPLVPPQPYCSIKRKTEATCWFQGFPLGVAAAESSGACNMCKTPVSPALNACMATPTCSPGCVPCAPTAGGQIQPHMIESASPFLTNQPPVPQNVEAIEDVEQVEINDPTVQHAIADQDPDMVPPAPQPTPDASPNSDKEIPESQPASKPLEDLEKSLKSPGDRELPAPAEAIERAIDDVTQAAAGPNIESPVISSEEMADAVIARPTVESGVVAPRSTPASDPAAPPVPSVKGVTESISVPTQTTEVKVPTVENSGPVVGEPVDLPNIQVNYDWEGVDWLFGEANIAEALLETEIPSLFDE